MEKLVLIHVDDIEYHKIQNIASRMKITVDRIPEEIVTANYKLGELVNGAYKNAADTIDGTGREQENVTGHSSETGVMNAQAKSRADSLILVCNLKEKRLDKMLLSISTQPLLQYTFRASHCFSRYANAFAVSE